MGRFVWMREVGGCWNVWVGSLPGDSEKGGNVWVREMAGDGKG